MSTTTTTTTSTPHDAKDHHDDHDDHHNEDVESMTASMAVLSLSNVQKKKQVPKAQTKKTTTARWPKPPFKWVGGKTQLLDRILPRLPKTVEGDYVEPFVGGGSVLLAVLWMRRFGEIKIKGKVRAADANETLIAAFRLLQTEDEERLAALHARLVHHFGTFDGLPVAEKGTANRAPLHEDEARSSRESYYYWVRGRFNAEPKGTVESVAMFWFMNKTCFRGVYREGPRGLNVPYGNPRVTPDVVSLQELRDLSALLRDVEFTCGDFGPVLDETKRGDAVFLDPPYYPLNATSFVKYNADGFDEAAHERLFASAASLREKGVGLVMCNASVPRVHALFGPPEYDVVEVVARRAIHSKNPEATATEVLVVGNAAAA